MLALMGYSNYDYFILKREKIIEKRVKFEGSLKTTNNLLTNLPNLLDTLTAGCPFRNVNQYANEFHIYSLTVDELSLVEGIVSTQSQVKIVFSFCTSCHQCQSCFKGVIHRFHEK